MRGVSCEGGHPHPLPYPILFIISGSLGSIFTHEADFGDHTRIPLHSPLPLHTLPPHTLPTPTLPNYTPHTTLQPVARGSQKPLTPPLQPPSQLLGGEGRGGGGGGGGGGMKGSDLTNKNAAEAKNGKKKK